MISALLCSVATGQVAPEITELLDNERFSAAEKLLEKKISEEGNNPELNYLAIKTYLDQDKISNAAEFISKNKLSVTENADPFNQVAYARFLLQTGKKEEAVRILEGLADNKKNRKTPTLMMAMAEAYLDEENGDPARALEWLKLAEDKDEKNPEISLLAGKAYQKMGDINNTYLSYQQALKKDKRNVKAHYLLGKIFRRQQNTEVYMEHFGKAYDIDSTYAPVLEELYDHYYYRDPAKARRYLEKYMASSDPSIQNDYRLTDMLYLTGEYDKAIRSAGKIIEYEKEKAQARLYKLMAYAALKSGDSSKALGYAREYFQKEKREKLIASDYELRAILSSTVPGHEKETAEWYSLAAEKDTLIANKLKFAAELTALYKKTGEASRQAYWFGKIYQWKEKPNNLDLFNWGLAHYSATEYMQADSVFGVYTDKYPADIYGYYWKAQVNAAIDTAMLEGRALPYYIKVTETADSTLAAHRRMLLKAYGYLGGYEANIKKDYARSLEWFEKYLALDGTNENALRYAATLREWIEKEKKE